MKKIEPRPPQPAAPSANAPTLLYVEDEDANWNTTVMRMRNRYRMVRARNAIETVMQVRALRSTLAAVLMDIQLAGSELDGIALTRLLKGLPPMVPLPAYARDIEPLEQPIIFVTANETRYGAAMLLQCGASLVVPKPVDFVQLTTGLNNLILARRTARPL